MANMGYKVIQYDASISKAPYNHPNIIFIKKFVGARDSEDTISFLSVIKDNNLDENLHNILQCDIEDCEWEMLENIDLDLVSKFFSQIIFEFHNCDIDNESFTQRRLKVLEKLNSKYTPIHAHFNNNGKIIYCDGLLFSTLIEVSYIRNDLVPRNAKYKQGSGYLAELDAPNLANFPDVPIFFDKSFKEI